MTDAISVVGLSRVYQPRVRGQARTALDTVSLTVRAGETHGLLGPNGAGKTTLVKILATLLAPTSGRASVFGYDVVSHAQDVRRAVGLVLGGDRGHYPSLTAEQNLRYWAAMYGYSGRAAQTRVRDLLERFGLAERAAARVETFSRGMKQRLHLARGLVGDSPVLVLDEPTAGMDPLACQEFREITRQLGGEGRTVLITTHDMAEAQELCDRVTLINEGRLLATEQPAVLAGRLSRFEHVDVTASRMPHGCLPSGCGSPVRATRAVATSSRVART